MTVEPMAERDGGGFRPGRRWIAVAVAAMALLLVGWALLAPRAGFAWPYPQRLPDQISFRGFDYTSDKTCLSRQKVLAPFGGDTWLVAFGSLPSAVIFGGPQMLAALSEGTDRLEPGQGGVPMTIYVASGSCFVTYSIVQGPL